VDSPGRTFHVSPNGSDFNPGTESQPWATISRGVASLEPGDVLIVHGGTYHEVIVINVSGTPEAPIEIRAAPGEEVIVDQSGFGSNCLVFAPGASYVRVSSLRLFDCDIWAVSLDGGNSHVELNRLEISRAESGGRDRRSVMLTALKERYRRGEISEELYRELRRKCESGG